MNPLRVFDIFDDMDLQVDLFEAGSNIDGMNQGWYEVQYAGDTVISGLFSVEPNVTIDSDEAAIALFNYLALNDGETGGPDEGAYTEEQREFVRNFSETFGLFAQELEGGIYG